LRLNFRTTIVSVALLTACLSNTGAHIDANPSFATQVHSFDPGANAGFGATSMPEIVLGAPDGKGLYSGSMDVLSLGAGGEIILDFGDLRVVNGPGPDLVVFENAFYTAGSPEYPFSEFAEISVSLDGQEWFTFPCTPDAKDPQTWEGCAGWTPVYAAPDTGETITNPLDLGGDSFDLEELGVERIRFVRIRDLSTAGISPSAGFDLDAVAAVYTTASK